MTTARRSAITTDLDVERAFIAGAIAFPEFVDGIADELEADYFSDMRLGMIWSATKGLLADGLDVDRLVVLDRVRTSGVDIDLDILAQLPADPVPPKRAHVEILLRLGAARKTASVLAEARGELGGGTDPYEVAQATAAALDEVGLGAARGKPEAMTLPELFDMAEASAPWVVPGLLRSDWRCVVVASEGLGKSTLLRQIAIASAQGIHPLTFQHYEPIRTLIIDAENPLAAIAETGLCLEHQARATVGDEYDPARCRVWSRPGGIDVRVARDRADLVRELRHQRPQLVVAGPVYKLGTWHDGESYEDAAEGILAVLDDLRTRFKFALLLEHHAPKPQQGKRELLPFGSQRWMAWPEIGLNLRQAKSGTGMELGRFRGDRLKCHWPDRLEGSSPWLWSGVWERGFPRIEDL